MQVTRIHEFFKSLTTVTDEIVQQEQLAAKSSQLLLDISQIILVGHANFDEFLRIKLTISFHLLFPDGST